MCKNKKVIGLILLSMGVGMLIVIIIPWWGFLLAAVMVIIGFCNLFIR